jgi:dopamine receptor D1
MDVVVVDEGPQCQLDFSPIYSITSSIVSFFLPCVIMLIIYFHLYAIAKHHMKAMKAHTQPLIRLRLLNQQQQLQQATAEGQNGGCEAGEASEKGLEKRQMIVTIGDTPLLQEHKAAITIGIIMGVFLLCWMPFFIINVVAGFCKDCISATTFKVYFARWLLAGLSQ